MGHRIEHNGHSDDEDALKKVMNAIGEARERLEEAQGSLEAGGAQYVNEPERLKLEAPMQKLSEGTRAGYQTGWTKAPGEKSRS